MKITDAVYETSITTKRVMPTAIPEIAIAGKSNVGKSSFINMITSRKKLARSSAEPGRTRMLNYFNINKGEFYLVDLPGYGYAKVTENEKEAWKEIVEYYFTHSTALKHVFLIVDIRHDPSPMDIQLAEYLLYYKIPFTVVATKADKLSRMQRLAAARSLQSVFSPVGAEVFVASSAENIGKEEVLSLISNILSESASNN